MMDVRSIRVEDAERFLELALALDRESDFMLLEPGERSECPEDQRRILERVAASANEDLWVAVDRDALVGFLAVARPSARRARHRATVVVGVRASHQRRGLAYRLFEAAESWARAQGVRRLELTVLAHNEPARRLYETRGFQCEGVRRASLRIGEELFDELAMAKILPPVDSEEAFR